MKLFYSPTSPYARKVRATAVEKGVAARIELLPCNPHEPDPALLAANPLGRVPTLVLDDAGTLYDSPVICEWLDGLTPAPRLVPAAGPERWRVLRIEALADGMLDDAVAIVLDGRRPESQQSPALAAARGAALLRGVAALEQDLEALSGRLDLAAIAAACALGYLDFRLPGLEWRNRHPAVAAWFAGFARRESMEQTRPPTA